MYNKILINILVVLIFFTSYATVTHVKKENYRKYTVNAEAEEYLEEFDELLRNR